MTTQRQNKPGVPVWLAFVLATVSVFGGLFGGGRCSPLMDIQTKAQAAVDHETIKLESKAKARDVENNLAQHIRLQNEMVKEQMEQTQQQNQAIVEIKTDMRWIRREMQRK